MSSRLASELLKTTRQSWRAHSLLMSSRHCGRNYSAAVVNTPAPLTDTKHTEASPKRFWKTVGIDTRNDHIAITLDKRALKTPSGNRLLIPIKKRFVATLIANEWENQDKVLKPHALPMTSLVSRAIDTMCDKKTRNETIDNLLNYFDTDTICFFADSPKSLVKLQDEHWNPLLAWIQGRHNIQVKTYHSLLDVGQSPKAKAHLRDILSALDEWQLAALERATLASKSLIIALALVQGRIDVEQAAKAAHVEVDSQIDKWGEVEDTHDVDYHDIRRQLGSAACLLSLHRK